MPSTVFDIMRRRDPNESVLINHVEEGLARILGEDPNAVIDDVVLSQRLHESREAVAAVLVVMVSLDALETLYLWRCPNGKGTTLEGGENDLQYFPSLAECERCGGLHRYDPDDIDVMYLPSVQLAQDLDSSRRLIDYEPR